MADDVRILTTTLDPAALTAELVNDRAHSQGALVTFVGMVRDLSNNPVSAMQLEHYPGMTEKSLAAIIGRARARWPLGRVLIVHRVGMLHPGEPIVFVGVTGSHRREAFAACEFLMDYLKTEAPFWKKEITPEGERWVEAKQSDGEAAQRWRAAQQQQQ